MFGKLLKYEWKSNYKLLGLLSVVALFVGFVGGITIRGMFWTDELVTNDFAYTMAMLGLFSMAVICVVAIGIYATAVSGVNYFRFYKHKFTDEGYLTFTLPVTAEQVFWSSFLHILIWTCIASVVCAVSILVMCSIGIGPWFMEQMRLLIQEIGPMPTPNISMEDWKQLWEETWDLLVTLVEEGWLQTGAPMYYVMTALQSVITPIYSIMLIMTCITVGSVLVKRMKLLLSIGIYAGFTSVVALLTQISVYVPTFVAMYDYEHYFYWMSIPMALQLVLQLTVIIGGYFLNIHLMKKKLNLP